MLKKKEKGRRNLNRCIQEFFSSERILVGKVEKVDRFRKEQDLFGLFDFLYIKNGNTVFVQVTSNRPHRHIDFVDFVRKWGVDVEQYVYVDRKGWRKYRYHEAGYIGIFYYGNKGIVENDIYEHSEKENKERLKNE